MKTAIVARKNEDTAWVQNLPAGWDLLLVQKDVDLPDLSGKGLESWYWGVVKLYPSLALGDLVAFLQGHPFDHCPDTLELLAGAQDGFLWLGPDYVSDGQGGPHDGGVPVREMYEKWVGEPFPGEIRFGAGGQCVMTGRMLLSRPVAEWSAIQVDAGLGRNDWAFERIQRALMEAR